MASEFPEADALLQLFLATKERLREHEFITYGMICDSSVYLNARGKKAVLMACRHHTFRLLSDINIDDLLVLKGCGPGTAAEVIEWRNRMQKRIVVGEWPVPANARST